MSEKISWKRNGPFWRALVHGKRACQVREEAVGNVITTRDVDNTRWPPTSSFSSGKHREAHCSFLPCLVPLGGSLCFCLRL